MDTYDLAVWVAERRGVTVDELIAQLIAVEEKHGANRDLCEWCETELPKKRRRDKRTCNASCRTAANAVRRKRERDRTGEGVAR